MGVKHLIFLVMVMVLVSGCAIGGKTKPVVTDITGAVVGEVQDAEAVSEEEVEDTGTITEEAEKEVEVGEEEEEKAEEKEEELPIGTHIVVIKDLRLNPQELTIKKGDTVVWDNQDEWEEEDETKHYLAAHSNEFRTPILYKGDTFEHTFNKTGVFTYIDVLYKDRSYLRGEIVVE